jgi:hypothetical protein
MNAKIMTAMFATLVMLCAGVVMAEVDAEETPTPYVTYKVGEAVILIDTDATLDGVYTLKGADIIDKKYVTEGKTFVGWNDGTNTVNAGSQVVNKGGLTYSAEFKDLAFDVVFKDGEKVVYTAKDVTYGTTLETVIAGIPSEAVPEDKDTAYFKDWGMPADTVVKGAMTLSAVYTPIFKVTWTINDAEVGHGVTDKDGKLPIAPVKDPSMDNCTFDGWAVDGRLIDPASFVPTADVTLDAVFTPTKLTVVFMDGEKVVYKTTVLYGQTIPAKDVPAGYDWDLDLAETIVEDTVIQPVKDVPVEPEPVVEKSSNTMTYSIIAMFAIIMMIGAVVGIRQLKK